MQLHCANRRGGVLILPILVPLLGNGGGEVNRQNWQGSAPHLPKIVFLFLGFVLESAGMSSKKFKEADSKTTNPVVARKKS